MRHRENGDKALGPRQIQILEGVCRGASNKAIAHTLATISGTPVGAGYVQNELNGMYRELRVDNRTALARWAFQNPAVRRGEYCPPGLHPANCTCGTPDCAEMLKPSTI